ncbi:hypothetical protein UFOVP460_29 [uncultured Caudovirales phage]|uniref:Uncharacterized protein n=1 Tax=uncultured Caudovirales phage TaxID=2100421 RepID=A0A6J5MDT2_9CAUD|nr:hypothetical protein UFOVP460_29 [uncultured Caudovirales phage]
MLTYKRFGATNYIVLSDGTVARLLKPSDRKGSKYINFTVRNKMLSMKLDTLVKKFSEAQGDVINDSRTEDQGA